MLLLTYRLACTHLSGKFFISLWVKEFRALRTCDVLLVVHNCSVP